MKLLIALLMPILFTNILYSQNGSLHGIITNSTNNKLISDATIQISNKSAISDLSGYYSFSSIPVGKYAMLISHIGYKPEKLEITIGNANSHIDIKLSPININLREVIITSSKYEKNINELPYSASLITKDEILNNPSVTISDILKTEPGIALLSDGAWGTDLSIRGMNRANIVTMVDGNRLETATDINARLSMTDINDIERIEVIKGAASSLYGSGASGGVVNIITKTGNYRNSFGIDGSLFSSYGSVNNYLSNGINLFAGANNWFGKITGNYRKAGNTKTPLGDLYNSQFEDFSFSGFLQYKPFENNEIKINYQQFKALNVGIPGAYPVFPSTATIRYPEEKRQLFSAEYLLRFESSIFNKLSTKYFHQYIYRNVENIPHIIQNLAGTPPKRVSVLSINPNAKHNIDGFQSQADLVLNNQYIIAGVDIWRRKYSGERSKQQKIEVLNSTKDTVKSTSYKTIYEKPLPDATFSSNGIFAQDEIKLFNNSLVVTVGGRFDYIFIRNNEIRNPIYVLTNGVVTPQKDSLIYPASTAKNNSYVYNLGLVYSVFDNFNLTMNLSRSFRSPSLEERFQYIDQGSLILLGNPQLNPEKGYFLDAGFHYIQKDMHIAGNIFYNNLTDLVSDSATTYEGRKATMKMNVGKAVLYGFELSSSFNILQYLEIYDNISYVRGRNEKDQSDLPFIAPLNAVIGIKAILHQFVQLNFSATLFDKQNKIAKGETATPGYAIFNFSASLSGIDIDFARLNFIAGIENIMDKAYRNHLSTNKGLISIEAGRNIFLKMNVTF